MLLIIVPNPRQRITQTNIAAGRPSTTFGTQVTCGAQHTLSAAYADILTTTYDSYEIIIVLSNTWTSNTQTDMLVNLYKGDAGAEQPFIMGLLAGWAGDPGANGDAAKRYRFPLFIPAGTRISAKAQGFIASDTVNIAIFVRGGGAPQGWVGTGVESLGINTSTSLGTSITGGTTSEGTFVNIGTSKYRYGFVYPILQGTISDTGSNNGIISLDIGVGGAAIGGLGDGTFYIAMSNAERHHSITEGCYCDIPAGTLLQLRAQGSGNSETYDTAIYGVY